LISLKTQNLPLIILYLLFNLMMFIATYSSNIIELDGFTKTFQTLSKKDGIVFTLLPIIIFILLGVVPSNWKEIFVFWKKNNRLPGCYAFSKYAKEDNRIDIKLLKSKYGKFPKKPSKQNALWYGIYRNIKDKGIDKTHKDFLLARELTIITLLFIVIAIPSLFLFTNMTDNNNILWLYVVFLLVEYLVLRFIAKNHAERMVTNVLAYESSRLLHERLQA